MPWRPALSLDERDRIIATLRDENRHLARSVSELSLLNDLANAISQSLATQDVVEMIVQRAIRAVGAEQGAVVLLDGPAADTGRGAPGRGDCLAPCQRISLHPPLLAWMRRHREPLLSNEPRTDPRLEGLKWNGGVGSLLCLPLLVKGDLRGVLTVCNKRWGAGFSSGDQRLLGILASQAAQIVENSRLREEEQDHRSLQEELVAARRIQEGLLPEAPPVIPGYELAGESEAARTIGGDYYDYIQAGKSEIAVCLGDVCGKGMPASLLMANLQAIIRTQTLARPPSEECLARCHSLYAAPARQGLERSNRLLCRCTRPERFVTLFYGLLDFETHSLRFSNAGHLPPLLRSTDGEARWLRTGGIPLGILEEWAYQEETIRLRPGDLLVLYTDGVTETRSPQGEEFGEGRLEEAVRSCAFGSAADVIGSIRAATNAFSEGSAQQDDRTVVVLRRDL